MLLPYYYSIKLSLCAAGMVLCMLLADSPIVAQDHILISDSLVAHAELLDIYSDNLTGKSPKFTIGDYEVLFADNWSSNYVHSEIGALEARSKSEVTKIISFSLVSTGGDTAFVTTEDKQIVLEYYPNVVFPNFPLELITDQKPNTVTAWIVIPGDSAITWMLSMQEASPEGAGLPIEMVLTNGVKMIEPVLVTSDADFDYDHPFRSLLKMPALGIEFYDEGSSLCALQFSGGAASKSKKNTNQSGNTKAWIYDSLDEETRLMLIAAMATLMLAN